MASNIKALPEKNMRRAPENRDMPLPLLDLNKPTIFTAGARTQAIVLAVEDAQWADPTTLDVMRGIAERAALASLFVLITARPEFRSPWGARSHHGTISASTSRPPSGAGHGQRARGSTCALERGRRRRDRAHGRGVPLFVEELTRLLLDRGEQGTLQAIPPTLQQSLAARLDRLGSARRRSADRGSDWT